MLVQKGAKSGKTSTCTRTSSPSVGIGKIEKRSRTRSSPRCGRNMFAVSVLDIVETKICETELQEGDCCNCAAKGNVGEDHETLHLTTGEANAVARR